MEHDVIPLGERHQPHNFEYADEAERLAAVVTDAKWLQSLALQLDNGSYWRVTGVSPATWEQVVTAWVDIPGKPTEFPPEAHSHAISEVVDLQDELDAKEPLITKAIGYAKWTGSAWSFVNENYMQTSHAANGIAGSDITNWNTAFGWGNHASAGYQASLGFTAENVANKSTNATTDASSNTKYPSVKAIVDYAVSADASVLSSAATDATTKANAAQAAAIAASTPVSHLGSGGTAHANVVAAGAAGFMTGADKTKLDAITGANSGDETGARIATLHHAASAKTTLVDADELTGQDSAAGFGLIRVTWANIKATLATWIGGGTIAGSFTTLAASGNTTLGDAEATDTHAVKGATTVLANSASPAMKVTQTGSGNAFVVEDVESDTTPFLIDADGRIAQGGPSYADIAYAMSRDIGGATSSYAFRSLGVGQTTATANVISFSSAISTIASAYTLTNMTHFCADLGAIGAGSTVTNQHGFRAAASLVGATNNYGFHSEITADAGRWNFYAAGDARNYFAGKTAVGDSTDFAAYGAPALTGGGTSVGVMTVHTGNSFYQTYSTTAPTDKKFWRFGGVSASGDFYFETVNDAYSAATPRLRLPADGGLVVTSPGGLGYGTGAGGTVTQATSRSTGVTVNKPTGAITLFSTTATTGTFASFTLTNTLIAATDVVIVNFASATSANKYSLFVTAVAAGSCRIQVYNIAAVAVAEAPVINFAVIKGATS